MVTGQMQSPSPHSFSSRFADFLPNSGSSSNTSRTMQVSTIHMGYCISPARNSFIQSSVERPEFSRILAAYPNTESGPSPCGSIAEIRHSRADTCSHCSRCPAFNPMDLRIFAGMDTCPRSVNVDSLIRKTYHVVSSCPPSSQQLTLFPRLRANLTLWLHNTMNRAEALRRGGDSLEDSASFNFPCSSLSAFSHPHLYESLRLCASPCIDTFSPQRRRDAEGILFKI